MTSRFLRIAGALFIVQALAAQSAPPAGPKVEDVFRAIRANDLDALRLLVSKADATAVKDGVGTTPLHYAATYGTLDAVRLLVDAGADLRARTSTEVTPLIPA